MWVRGGVCYFLWDKAHNNHDDLLRVVTYKNNKIIDDTIRPIAIEGSDIFIRDSKAFPILEKVSLHENTQTLDDHISPRRPFGLGGHFVNDKKFRPAKEGLSSPIICYGRSRAVGYLDRDEVTVRSEWVDRWKLFTPRANNIGTELNDDNLNTFIGAPGTICTESYIVIGAELELDEDSSENLSKYLATKFARYLHSLAKASHDATAKTYRFIPLQDFSSGSDINWSLSVQEVDEQLYKKYGLSKAESQHIEKKIKTMENV